MWTRTPSRFEPRRRIRHPRGAPRRRPAHGGVTLIELLGVVAISAFVTSHLGRGRRGARPPPRAAVCGQTLHSFGSGLGTYTSENADWLPGYNTSGVAVRALELTWNSAPDVLFNPRLPVQSWDWLTPLLSGDRELPALRAGRFKTLLEEYRCPSQRYTSTLWSGGLSASPDAVHFEEAAPWPAVSYLMPAHFQFFGQHDAANRVLTYLQHGGMTQPISARAAPEWFEVVTYDYLPRADRVGTPARKIFVADGTRYVDYSGLIDHDVSPNPQWFGSFTTSGGWWAGSTAYGVKSGSLNWNGDPVGEGSESDGKNLAVSYRHGLQSGTLSGHARDNSGSINALFYDGHVQRLSDRQSREVHLWYPTGSVVKIPSEGMTNMPMDFVIP